MPKMTTLGLHEYLDYNLEKSFEMRRIYTVVENRSKKSHHIVKASEASWKPDKESQILKKQQQFFDLKDCDSDASRGRKNIWDFF